MFTKDHVVPFTASAVPLRSPTLLVDLDRAPLSDVVDAVAPLDPETSQDAPGGDKPPSWRAQAACRDIPTDLFFPIGHGARAVAQATLAKQVCADCPVRLQCLGYALRANARYGVYGGTDEEERRLLRRHLARALVLPGDSDDQELDELDGSGLPDEDLEESA